MKNKLICLAVGLLLGLSTSTVLAESTLLFAANPVTKSDRIMTPSQAISFATKSLVLTCGTPHKVIISSTPDGRGGILVDNFLTVNGINVCPGGNCFFGSSAPINPLDISNVIANGKQLVPFYLMDWGVQLQNSALYLVMTNCTVLARETICHNPGISLKRTLGVTQSVISEHLGHGDALGACK